MFQSLCFGYFVQILFVPCAERTAGSSQQDFVQAFGAVFNTLVNSRMFAVDRNDIDPCFLLSLTHQAAAGNQRFFIGQC